MARPCSNCGGSGDVNRPGSTLTWQMCPACGGTGTR